ncbi:MAG: peptidoglycan-binding domain-containing protein [Propionibacteriales bacterium]|nr:peptidoglycan-binding domain-containing protein [Propionibacteriales bacterium]
MDLRTRSRLLLVVAAVAALATLVGWVVGSRVTSTADRAAGSRAPARSVITAPVEMRRLSTGMVTRGVVGSLATASGVPVVGPAGVARAIVTAVPVRVGRSLAPGAVVLEVSGSPVFFLPGRIAPYRDLGVGDRGTDVRQLRRGLARAGLRSTDEPGTYAVSTARAVRRLFARHGYVAPAGGARFPMSGVVFVAAERASVTRVAARINQPLADAEIGLATGDLVVLVDVEPAAADTIVVDATVELTAELLGETERGTVTRLLPGGGERPPRAVVTTNATLPAGWAGQDVRVEVASRLTAAEVLAVPVSALFRAGDGTVEVVVVAPGGERRPVEVGVGATAGGFVEVVPPHPEQLRPGTDVLVGTRR